MRMVGRQDNPNDSKDKHTGMEILKVKEKKKDTLLLMKMARNCHPLSNGI